MPQFKYFEGIKRAQAQTQAEGPKRLDPFDLTPFITRSRIKQAAVRFVFRKIMPALFAFARRFWPIPRIGRLVIVTRDEDVREVLDRPEVFRVPFELEMTELGGVNSVLGLDGLEHDRFRETIKRVLDRQRYPNDLADIERWSRGYADNLVEASSGRLDVVTDLITRSATETCCRYFGLSVNDPNAFAHWTMAISALLFADPFGDKDTRKLALNGAARVRAVLEDAVLRVRANINKNGNKYGQHPPQTLVQRFVADGKLTDPEIVATLMGLAVGFIPTNTLAAGNMLEELLARPHLMARARAAALAGKADKLEEVLFECARLNPALSPGQWRHVPPPEDGEERPEAESGADRWIAKGTSRARRVKAGDIVLAAISSALRDPRASRPNPAAGADLIFGFGSHSCLGKWVAMKQIVQVFMALLARPRLAPARRHGWMQRMGIFPMRLDMTFESATSTQSMIIVSAPVKDGAAVKAIEEEIERFDPRHDMSLRERLNATNLVHFASLSAVEHARDRTDEVFVLLEINADGPADKALEAVASAGFDCLSAIFGHCRPGEGFSDPKALAAFLREHMLDLHCWPWGPIGIHYNGTPEFSVRDIDRQERLAAFSGKALDHFFGHHLSEYGRPMEALTRVRRFTKQDSFYLRRKSWAHLLDDAKPFEFSLVRPSRKRLALAEWQPPSSHLAGFGRFFRSADGIKILVALLLGWVASTAGLILVLDPFWIPGPGGGVQPLYNAIVFTLAVLGGAIVTLLITLIVTAGLAFELWLHESSDAADDRTPDFADMRELAAREDHPGYEQNHIIAVVPLKRGFFRKFTFGVALWGIKQSLTHWFRPGFVVTMGTIHYAKWFRVPGTDQFIFLSNYDGSWESYLEDFITRAHEGQSAAWSNGIGFPRTRLLIFEGAKDGDRFKRWVRRQQRVTRFWYSRFPNLTTKQIRNNAIIEHGLANAVSDTDARRWIACFGSAQREAHEIETSEAQAILFSGFGNLHHASCIVFRLPGTARGRLRWLEALNGVRVRPIDRNLFGLGGTPRAPLPAALRIAFGDHPVESGAVVLGLSALGLEELGLGGRDGIGGLSEFPAAFKFGMAGRGRTLDEPDAARTWLWSDCAAEQGEAGAHGVLVVYGQETPPLNGGTKEAHERLAAKHLAFLRACGGRALHVVPTGPLTDPHTRLPTLHREHFGFRDGISQPVIRGSRRTIAAADRDLVEPGEFILGYLNNQGYYPPLVSVAEETDQRNELPILNAGPPGRFPRFGSGVAGANARDFGRNGSFLVVRQIDQNVEGFWRSCCDHALSLQRNYRNLEDLVGHKIDEQWVAAKMVGRWIDGQPLVRQPTPPRRGDPVDNDFSYGIDDPRGLQCPLSAHIRRGNPRDSLEPGDTDEQFITNRHRLLRRSRVYDYEAEREGANRKGLLFMALCADLERQFEFIQHSWINASSFHGLTGEPDPIAGNIPTTSGEAPTSQRFTIPMPGGNVVLQGVSNYVTVRAGGYFFLPSLSAIRYLCSLASASAFGTGAPPEPLKEESRENAAENGLEAIS